MILFILDFTGGNMDIQSEELFSQVNPQSTLGKIIQFPITRIFSVCIFFVPVLILSNLLAIHVIEHSPEPFNTILNYPRDILTFFGVLFAYRLYGRVVEQRKTFEITGKSGLREFGLGALISLGIVGFMILLMAGLGYYRIDHFDSPRILINRLFHFGMAAFLEELLFRAILFKLIEEWCGSWIALVTVGILFGFGHIINPNATFWTSLGLVISDSFLLAGAYMLTRRIWMVWGLHMSWNFFQAAVFGMPNSGKTFTSWIIPTIHGPGWITGGSFGIEASYIQIVISLAVGLFILREAIDNDQLVLPVWRRK